METIVQPNNFAAAFSRVLYFFMCAKHFWNFYSSQIRTEEHTAPSLFQDPYSEQNFYFIPTTEVVADEYK